MLWLFTKKVKLFDTSSKVDLDRREKLLNDAGIRTNVWETGAPVVIGGPHMKTSDWNSLTDHNKDDERVVYHLEVAQEDQYKAMNILLADSRESAEGTETAE